ncbi:MAG: phenylacetic acid degradation operon negative regulatory protein PaaX [Rhodospirillaceae bacterium]|nr:phenylacetic acid degradation operon negative regulatory protein PaaX [Rhodospirillaceae bacterium]
MASDPTRRLAQAALALREALRPRAKSLIMSVWGDAIAPHGGAVWLGSLIRLLAPLGLNERLVRTGVLRLVRDGWLTAQPIGRRSYYGLTEAGRRVVFGGPARRFYAAAPLPWDGRWLLLLTGLGSIEARCRAALKRELTWLGFGTLAPGVFAHPQPDRAALDALLRSLGVADAVQTMEATAEHADALLRNGWTLSDLAADYRRFLETFRPIRHGLDTATAAASLEPETAFVLRTLAMHEFRRLVLRDPDLPAELLPADWAGAAARTLCRNLYRTVEAEAERHLMAVLETADGPLPEAAPYYYDRFGGLARPRDAA